MKDSKAHVLSFWVLLDRPPPLRPGIQAIQSAGLITIPPLHQRLGEGGCQQKGGGGGGLSGLKNDKLNTGSTAPNHAVYGLHLHITF
jgi:hypothetical protein